MTVNAMVSLIFDRILHIIYCSFAEILIFLKVMVMLFMLPVMQMNLEREARQLRKEVMFLVLVLEQLAMENLGPLLINLQWKILVHY